MTMEHYDELGRPLTNGDYIARGVRSCNSGAMQFYRITDVDRYKAVLLHREGFKNSNVTLTSYKNTVLLDEVEELLEREDNDE